MTGDDAPVGRLLSRREVVSALGVVGVAFLAGGGAVGLRRASAPAGAPAAGAAPSLSCIARPRQTAGPFFVDDERLERSDIRTDPAGGPDARPRPGVPLALTFAVSRLAAGVCRPIPRAQVDLWQCDAAGVYSDVRDARSDTRGRKFLRGYQVTDDGGTARFVTIYPGWYPGRTVHLHFKIRTDRADGPGYELTSQLYFDDALVDRVHATAPYADRPGRRTRNAEDGIFRHGGDRLLLAPTEGAAGHEATFAVGLEIPS